jgi:hypothetical protein
MLDCGLVLLCCCVCLLDRCGGGEIRCFQSVLCLMPCRAIITPGLLPAAMLVLQQELLALYEAVVRQSSRAFYY